MKIPIQKVRRCNYCTDYKGDPKPIPPQDLQYAIKMPSGDYKCLRCQEEELRDRIVRVTPNSQRAKEIIAEQQREVNRYNDYGQRLNKSAGYELMKLKKGKYQ
jgi:uncharacterized protein with von Willebrand factor type A (vWA) domain